MDDFMLGLPCTGESLLELYSDPDTDEDSIPPCASLTAEIPPELSRDLFQIPFSEESLAAISLGLDPQPEDEILSIADLGDVLFALLEKGCKVTGYGPNIDALEYVVGRAQKLRDGDNTAFLDIPWEILQAPWIAKSVDDLHLILKARNEYFRQDGRLESIRANLGNLMLISDYDEKLFQKEFGDMYCSTKCFKRQFTKMYLSSDFNYVRARGGHTMYIGGLWDNVATDKLSVGGLVYVTERSLDHVRCNLPPTGFEFEWDLTMKARELEPVYTVGGLPTRNSPTVYRKVEDINF